MAAQIEVILTEDVKHVGKAGELVSVKPGFARNWLLPESLAKLADLRNLEAYEREKTDIEETARQKREKAEEDRKTIESEETFVLQARAGESGKLFGTITKDDLAKAIYEALSIKVNKQKINIPFPIKMLGEFKASVDLDANIRAEFLVRVEPR
jgi:large subunit ribosomal protein L9